MSIRLPDEEIKGLLAVKKPLPPDFRKELQLKAKRGHEEREIEVKSSDGSEFHLILRQSMHNKLDFSVILAYRLPGSTELFRLRRYNGKHGEHTNRLEAASPFYDFHVHLATARYQELGMAEDTYAEPTDRYSDLDTALQCMLSECGFESAKGGQGELFVGELQ
jgi:hypothetical protein